MSTETLERSTTQVATTDKEKKITFIPASKSLHPERDGVTPNRDKKRVAAYCRVSTLLEEQQGSYELQQKYYESMIARNPNWELVGIYGDEGKSGTSLKGRVGFLTMMNDVRAGKIDYIITKATSRFGRNNSEFISILDELETYGVEVLFESEGIVTSGNQNRSMLQIMGVTNEQYSNMLSNNVRWASERRMRHGEANICNKRFMGYRKGEDGKPEIVEEEAEVIRMIYTKYLDGESIGEIARDLMELGIRTPGDKLIWRTGTIRSILSNEKYCGDALLQKTYKKSYLDKRTYKNTGEKAQVLVENNHPAIIDKKTFAMAQELLKERKGTAKRGVKANVLSGRIQCEDCGGSFGHKTWTSRGKIKYDMWVCNNKYTEDTAYQNNKCLSANIRQEWIEQGYVDTINQILAQKSEYLAKCEGKIRRLEHRCERISAQLKDKKSLVYEKCKTVDEMVSEMEASFYGEELEQKKMDLEAELYILREEIQKLEEEREAKRGESARIQRFADALKKLPEEMARFNGEAFTSTVRRIEVGQMSLKYCFYNGDNLKVKIEDLKKKTR